MIYYNLMSENAPRFKLKKIILIVFVVLLASVIVGVLLLKMFFGDPLSPGPVFPYRCPDELIFEDGEVYGLDVGLQVPLNGTDLEWVQANCRFNGEEKALPDFYDRVQHPDLPVFTGLGINILPYDPITRSAGDFVFGDNFSSVDDQVVKEFERGELGFTQLVEGTLVHAVTQGTVKEILDFNWKDGLSVVINYNEKWGITYGSLSNVSLDVGDRVSVGQVIGTVYSEDGIGSFDISVTETLSPGSRRYHCPMNFLDPSVVDQLSSNMQGLMNVWEELQNDSGIYNEEKSVRPGCEVFWTR